MTLEEAQARLRVLWLIAKHTGVRIAGGQTVLSTGRVPHGCPIGRAPDEDSSERLMAAHLPIHVIAGEVKVCGHGFLRSVVETLEQHPKRNPARAVEVLEFRPTRRPSFPTGQRRPESRLGLEEHRVRIDADLVDEAASAWYLEGWRTPTLPAHRGDAKKEASGRCEERSRVLLRDEARTQAAPVGQLRCHVVHVNDEVDTSGWMLDHLNL